MPAESQHRHHHPEDITKEHSFDKLARRLASGAISRRQALKLVGMALLGGVGLSALLPSEAEANHNKTCPGVPNPPGGFSANCCGGLAGVKCHGSKKAKRRCVCPPGCTCVFVKGGRACECP
jgi:hypothetical protein